MLKMWGTPDYAYGSMVTSGCKEKSLRQLFRSVDLKDALLPLGIKQESQKGRTNLTANDIFSSGLVFLQGKNWGAKTT